VRRPPIALLAFLVLVSALAAGCDDKQPPGGAAPSTSRTGGAAGSSTTTVPAAAGRFVGAWSAAAKDFWALTSEPCPRPDSATARCAVVSRTTDGGQAWSRLARLDVGTTSEGTTESVTAVHFNDAQHGWVYNRVLYATFNGGRRWQKVDLGNPVVALDSAGSTAFALVGSCAYGVGNCSAPLRLFEGTISTGRWRFLSLGFDLPATDVGNLIVSPAAVYAVVVRGLDQTFLARTGPGRWERRTLPCPRAFVAPIQGEDGLVAACRPLAPTGPVELQTSSDGGRTWAVVWQHTFSSPVSSLAVAGRATIVGLENGDILRSIDNGMNFVIVLETGAAPALRFFDVDRGTLLAGSPNERHLYRTTDGGATWESIPPP
jgi:photosystem II stability/assembly factor-like uncharacterized protein